MEVLSPDGLAASATPSAVTIGAFDGVHLGHQELIAGLRAAAAAEGLRSVVVTFDRHPAALLRPDRAPKLLTDLDTKLELLAGTGVDATVVVPFDEQRRGEDAEGFVRSVLLPLGTRRVHVGANFHFGRDRGGNVEVLGQLGRELGFEVEGLELRTADVDPISSTRIRALVAEGHVEEAGRLLGRAHRIRGTVVRGAGRGGAELGYPTANLEVAPETAVPALGVYAGRYHHQDGSVSQAAISVGKRPTFYEDAEVLIEAFLLDFSGDLYGQEGVLEVTHFLRPELRFESVEALLTQMAADVAEAARLAAEA